jgi:hypothetical protein
MDIRFSRLIIGLFAFAMLFASCTDKSPGTDIARPVTAIDSTDLIKIATDINYDIIISPPEGADPWDAERVSGYQGTAMTDDLFEKIYSGVIIAYDYQSEAPLKPSDVRKIEKDIGSDRTIIAKIQFTEDWFYNPQTGEIRKVVKSMILGSEFRDSQGGFFGYNALFKLVFEE